MKQKSLVFFSVCPLCPVESDKIVKYLSIPYNSLSVVANFFSQGADLWLQMPVERGEHVD